MPDYSQSKIYKIYSKSLNLSYIGSTTQLLHLRLKGHQYAYKYWTENGLKYCMSYEVLKGGDAEISLVCDFPCDTKHELFIKEGEFMLNTECVNKKIAGRTQKEYAMSHIEEIKNMKHIYYELNKTHCNDIGKIWRNNNKYIISEQRQQYRNTHKEITSKRNKIYRDTNVEKLAEKQKIYRDANVEKLAEKQKIRCVCECGLDVNKAKITRHRKTKLHTNKMTIN